MRSRTIWLTFAALLVIAGVLFGQVTDAATGLPLQPYLELARTDDPRYGRMGEGTTADYRILLPSNVDVRLTVASQGYKPWTYPGLLNLGPGQELRLDVQLLKIDSSTAAP